jgi:hypothetical protein
MSAIRAEARRAASPIRPEDYRALLSIQSRSTNPSCGAPLAVIAATQRACCLAVSRTAQPATLLRIQLQEKPLSADQRIEWMERIAEVRDAASA